MHSRCSQGVEGVEHPQGQRQPTLGEQLKMQLQGHMEVGGGMLWLE